jgi:hypothetical protein
VLKNLHFLDGGANSDPIYTHPVAEPNRNWKEFEAMAKRPLSQRIRYGFIKTYRPVLDDAPYRSFETMQEYRDWCQENRPEWLGFGR